MAPPKEYSIDERDILEKLGNELHSVKFGKCHNTIFKGADKLPLIYKPEQAPPGLSNNSVQGRLVEAFYRHPVTRYCSIQTCRKPREGFGSIMVRFRRFKVAI